MQRLSPLSVGFVMTVGAILGSRKRSRLDEAVAFNLDVARRKRSLFVIMKVVSRRDQCVVRLAFPILTLFVRGFYCVKRLFCLRSVGSRGGCPRSGCICCRSVRISRALLPLCGANGAPRQCCRNNCTNTFCRSPHTYSFRAFRQGPPRLN